MAYRDINLNNVMRGRVQRVSFHATGSEVLAIDDIADGNVVINEEIKSEIYETIDRQEIREVYGRKVICELVFDELDSSLINQLNGCDYALIDTTSGGANGLGRQIEISGSDYFKASINELRTQVNIEKSTDGDSLGYTTSDK